MSDDLNPSNTAEAKFTGSGGRWSDRYPVLLSCLREGRRPRAEEMRALADRIASEVGLPSDALLIARAALEGSNAKVELARTTCLPIRGH